jgi:bifunctional oligoribonuclease and PAP phosphatase NrnA
VLVSQADLQRLGAIEEHIEGMIDGLRQVQGVLAAAVIRETKNGESKVSLRSNNHALNVAAVLESMGGGGHKMAAGASWQASPAETWTVLQPKLEAAIAALSL